VAGRSGRNERIEILVQDNAGDECKITKVYQRWSALAGRILLWLYITAIRDTNGSLMDVGFEVMGMSFPQRRNMRKADFSISLPELTERMKHGRGDVNLCPKFYIQIPSGTT